MEHLEQWVIAIGEYFCNFDEKIVKKYLTW